MLLSPHERDKLLVHVAADLAWKRHARGVRLNYPEAVAILTAWVFEAARDGRSVVDEGLSPGQQVITSGQYKVQPGALVSTAVASSDVGLPKVKQE